MLYHLYNDVLYLFFQGIKKTKLAIPTENTHSFYMNMFGLKDFDPQDIFYELLDAFGIGLVFVFKESSIQSPGYLNDFIRMKLIIKDKFSDEQNISCLSNKEDLDSFKKTALKELDNRFSIMREMLNK